MKKLEEKSLYDDLVSKGISRRDFLKFCTIMGGFFGLQQSGIAQIVEAFENKPKKHVLWYHFQECTCCSESFLRASHPVVEQILLEMISLDYTDTLMAAAGEQAEEVRRKVLKEYYGKYIMVVEGAIPTGNPGYCTIAGEDALTLFKEGADGAEAIIAWGNCASAGCIQAAYPNPTGARPVHKLYSGKPIVNVQGCPPIADVMAGVITYIVTFGRLPELDNLGRPLNFYARRVHDSCYRRPAYDAGLFVQSFDDENAKKGYCLYYMGCKGPNTYNSCAIIKWNEGVSYPIQSGHGCIGCSERGFWDYTPMYQHLSNIHGIGIESTADKIGGILAGAAIGGIAAHAAATNIIKHKLIKNRMDDISLNVEEFEEEKGEMPAKGKECGPENGEVTDNKR